MQGRLEMQRAGSLSSCRPSSGLTSRGQPDSPSSPFRTWEPNQGLASHIEAVTNVRLFCSSASFASGTWECERAVAQSFHFLAFGGSCASARRGVRRPPADRVSGRAHPQELRPPRRHRPRPRRDLRTGPRIRRTAARRRLSKRSHTSRPLAELDRVHRHPPGCCRHFCVGGLRASARLADFAPTLSAVSHIDL